MGSIPSRSTARRPAVAAMVAVALLVAVCPAGTVRAQAPPSATPTATSGDHQHGDPATGQLATPTAAERTAAESLVRDTASETARFSDIAVARDEGYVQATPFWFGDLPAAHFASVAAVTDGVTLDPERPESLIYLRQDDGRLTFLGVMYAAPVGAGPVVGGPLTVWHTHQELCMNRVAAVPVLVSGRCPAATVPLPAEMLHVWVVPNALGPFAHVLPAADAATATGQTADEVRPVPLVDESHLQNVIGRSLGLAPDEISRRFGAGQSLSEMATAQGVDRDDLLRTIDDALASELTAATKAGQIPDDVRLLIEQFLTSQIRLFIDLRQDDGLASPVTTEFGFPCLDVSCLVLPA